MRERAASGTLSAHRSRGALDAAAYAPESPLVRWCSRRDELSADVVTAVACRDPGGACYGPRVSPTRGPAARVRSGGGPRLP